MAAPRENLLSLVHLTGTDRDTFTNQREQSLKKSFNSTMAFQADFSTHQSPQHLRVMHLQQRWQELKERERAAQQHNRQLLQQFEEAQGTLREMMARTAAMKTIRMEYERYLEESSPRWQQQLKEKTQAAQRKRMEEYLKMCLKNTEEEQVTKSSVDRTLQGPTKKPQKVSAPQEYYSQNRLLQYNQDDALQSTWLTRPQTVRFPVRVPRQPQGSSQAPPSFLPHPHPFQLQHLAATAGHHHPQPRQNPPAWTSPQPDHSWSWASGAAGMPSGCEALWGQLYMEEPPPERGVVPGVAEEAETSRATSSNTERGGGSRSSHLSQELDIKPVRLSSGHAESSESGRDSSQASREKKRKREKRGRAQRTSSERERRSSQESSKTSSAIVIASVAVAQTSESEASSEKGSTSSKKTRRRVEEVAAESPRMEMVAQERARSKGDDRESHNEESQCTGEESEDPKSKNAGNQSPVEKSESCRDESGSQREEGSGSVSIRLENGDADKTEEQESSSSEQSSAEQKVVEGKGHEKELGDGEEDDDEGGEEKEPNSQRDEEQEDRDVEVSVRKNTMEEEEETGAEDEMEEQESDEDQGDDEEQSVGLKNEDGEIKKQASSQDEELDEDESEGSEDKIEEDDDDDGSDEEDDRGGEEDEEQRSDKAEELEEERDSEDSIISPQENRPKKMHVILEESAEDDDGKDGSKTGSTEDDSNEISDEDNIEHLLAPQTQTKKKEEKDLKTDALFKLEKPEAVCDKVEIFQVTSTKTDHQSDSDEFDHFYD